MHVGWFSFRLYQENQMPTKPLIEPRKLGPIRVNVMPRKNYKYRRMVQRLPEEMTMLISNLDKECTVLEHNAGSMGWDVRFEIDETELIMYYDRGATWVEKEPGGEKKTFVPPKKKWWNSPMKELAKLLNQEFSFPSINQPGSKEANNSVEPILVSRLKKFRHTFEEKTR